MPISNSQFYICVQVYVSFILINICLAVEVINRAKIVVLHKISFLFLDVVLTTNIAVDIHVASSQ